MKNKLFAYLDKIGVDYKKETIGYNYFYNVAALARPAAIVSFDYTGSKCEVMATLQRKKMIERYAARYGYKIYNNYGVLGESWFYIASNEDFDAVSYMGDFVRRSVEACEKLNHLYHTGKTTIKTDAELNDKMKLIMDRFGREYKRMTFLVFGSAAV